MKELTLFVLRGCPYCRQAEKALEELYGENEAYRAVPIHRIWENEDPETCEQYDYYYVPTVFQGQQKLYEAHPGESFEECRDHVRQCLDAAMA